VKRTSANKPAILLTALICAVFGVFAITSVASAEGPTEEGPGLVPDGSDSTAPAKPSAPATPKKNSGSTNGSTSKPSTPKSTTPSTPKKKSTTKTKKKGRGLAVDSDGGGATGGSNGGTSTTDDPVDFSDDFDTGPVTVPNLVLKQFQIPPFLLPIYQAAGTQYGIRWEILAAINEIETDYGRNLNVSSAGALGWMQFMPATWEMYGVDANNDGVKDPYNPVDAIFAAAKYLKAAGGHDDIERAIFAYNHAGWYVDSVMLRAKLVAGVPDVVIDSLTGLTQGHFPVYARATYKGAVSTKLKRAKSGNAASTVEGSTRNNGVKIYSREGAPAISVQDSTIVKMGKNKRDGNFITLEDGFGNRYRYTNLGSLSKVHPVPRNDGKTGAEADAETAAAVSDPTKHVAPRVANKERIYANPDAQPTTGDNSFDVGQAMGASDTFDSYFARPYGMKKEDVVLKPMKVGSKVIGGTIIGRLGGQKNHRTPYVFFQVRPAGSGAPVIDPKPILDGWKLLDSTAVYRAMGMNPLVAKSSGDRTIGQILLMSKEELEKFVLSKKSIEIYEGGRRDIKAGQIDRRVLSVLAFLDSEGMHPTVTSLMSGHGLMTASGNISEHSTGDAVDIAAINGKSMTEENKPGGLMEKGVRKIMTLQGILEPHQIISLFDIGGASMAMGDHADHIHVGFRSDGKIIKNGKLRNRSRISKKTWLKLFDHLGKIENPDVSNRPSAYAVKVNKKNLRAHD
jgi:hypothetical protein